MKKVTIIGVGALGSHLVQLLRNEALIKVIDFDRVEQKNVLSQFHGKPSVGKLKVEGLKQSMQFMFGVKLETSNVKLDEGNSKQLLGGADLLIDCLDNGAGRRVIQAYARANKVPCLHGALAPGGELGRVVWDNGFVADDEGNAGAATCEDGEHLAFINVVSSYLAMAAQDFLKAGRMVGYMIPRKSGAILL